MRLRNATTSDISAIEALLLACGLSADGASTHIENYVVAEERGAVVAVAGFEACGAGSGLLRSVAVREGDRNRGVGRQILTQVVDRARERGITELYLLTTAAQGYFARLGFAAVARAEAPLAVRRTAQFSRLCPESAALMVRPLASRCGCADGTEGLQPDAAAESSDLFALGFYCAEAVLLSVAKHNGIESPLIPAIATGFCSGLSRTSGMCGALAGGILGINLVYGRDRAVESVDRNYAAVRRLIAEFEVATGSTNCSELLGCHLGTVEGQEAFRKTGLRERCHGYVATATTIAVSLTDEADR